MDLQQINPWINQSKWIFGFSPKETLTNAKTLRKSLQQT
jgi:hypothetical protein